MGQYQRQSLSSFLGLFCTALLGLGMCALNDLQIHDGDVDAPGSQGVRDYMLRYMAEVFVGSPFGSLAGQVAGWIVSGARSLS